MRLSTTNILPLVSTAAPLGPLKDAALPVPSDEPAIRDPLKVETIPTSNANMRISVQLNFLAL